MITVVLDGKFYKAAAVREAASDFGELATFEVTAGKGSITVGIDRIDPDVEEVLVDEFLNFALAGTIGSRG